MSAAHTPGPWITHESMRDCVTFRGRNGVENLFLENLDGYFACQNEADARLISAAPDLLEGLKECIGCFESDANRTINNWQSSDSSKADAYKKLERAKKYREAITKATGASA